MPDEGARRGGTPLGILVAILMLIGVAIAVVEEASRALLAGQAGDTATHRPKPTA